MRPVSRVDPLMPAHAYKTFGAAQPLATHFRPGTCTEADCGPHRNGWTTVVDETSELGRKQAHYIRKVAGRRFVEQRAEGGLTEFTFDAGQQCFRTHQIPLERPAVFYVRDGDWRTNGRRQVQSSEDWREGFAEHQDRLKTALERG